MPDLFTGDIEDPKAYPDKTILQDVRALIETGQREGSLIDYKQDISDRDKWSEAVVAFANTFGGLVIFGVETKNDVPAAMPGFRPKGETNTRLTNTLLSRVHFRPDFQVRIVKHDEDSTKEVAILRVSEGSRPPYMHSKADEHRVYVRMGARKAEADYLQLSALFEKQRTADSRASLFLSELGGLTSALFVMAADKPESRSSHSYTFVLAPVDDRARRRLTREVENNVKHHIECTFTQGHPLSDKLVIRHPGASYFRREMGAHTEQRFAITLNGSLGFVTHACIETTDGLFFNVTDFCQNLLDFLCLGASFYESSRYYGECQTNVSLAIPDKARVFEGAPNDPTPPLGSRIFEPPLESISGAAVFSNRIALHPLTSERLLDYLESVMNDLARMAGRVLAPMFPDSTLPYINKALKHLHES